MQINADLNLAFPVRWNDSGEPIVHAYHTPISRAIFESNHRIIASTATVLFEGDLGLSAMGDAALALRDAGRRDALKWPLPEGLKAEDGGTAVALLAEIKRLTLILAPSASGYDLLPVDQAIGRSVIDAEDWAEAESSIVFFTCSSSTARRRMRLSAATACASLFRGSITSSPPMEFAVSLRQSTPIATSEAPGPSSQPS
jgi:hypothetical protein